MATLENRRIGLEQEFFLVDEDGVLSNRADEFLDRCWEMAKATGREPEGYASECARSMVEISTPPVYTLEELSREYLASLKLAVDTGRELGLRLYSLATYPLRVEPSMRDELHYRLQARAVGRERFSHAGRCAGMHLHLEVAGGTVDPRFGVSYDSKKAARDWEDAVLDALRTAVERRMVSDVPVGVLLSGSVDSSISVGLLAEMGQPDLQTFSIGFETVGDIEGDEFEFSDIIAEHYGTEHHRFCISSERMLPALDGAINAMSEPMVSHDVVAFYLLSQEVAKHIKVVQSGQGVDEIFAGYDWYPPLANANGDGLDTYEAEFFDRPHAEMSEMLNPKYRVEKDVSREFVAEHFGKPGASTPLDRALRLDTEVMLVDDPVKTVDNMTMAWGLEARVPFLDHDLVELAAACPPELKLKDGGKGVLKEASRRVIPSEVIDREKGYFPVPALKHLEGPYLDLVKSALHAPAAKERGIFRNEYVDRLLKEPNDHSTRLGSNKLWQVALLELWLQSRGI